MLDEPRKPDSRDLLSPEEWRELLSPFEDSGQERAVLVLTDRPDDAETLQAFLAPYGIKCQPARNRYTALDLFRKREFAAIVTDPALWGKDAGDYLRRIRSVDVSVPLVLILDSDQSPPELSREDWESIAFEGRRPFDSATLVDMFGCLGLPPLRRELSPQNPAQAHPETPNAETPIAGAPAPHSPEPESLPLGSGPPPQPHPPSEPESERVAPVSGSESAGGERWPIDPEGEPIRAPLGPELPRPAGDSERPRIRPPVVGEVVEDSTVALRAFVETRQDGGRLLDALKLWCEREPLLTGVAILERHGDEWSCRVRGSDAREQESLLRDCSRLLGISEPLTTPTTLHGFHLFPDVEHPGRVYALRRRRDCSATQILPWLAQVLDPAPAAAQHFTDTAAAAPTPEDPVRWRQRFLELLRLRLNHAAQRQGEQHCALVVIEHAAGAESLEALLRSGLRGDDWLDRSQSRIYLVLSEAQRGVFVSVARRVRDTGFGDTVRMVGVRGGSNDTPERLLQRVEELFSQHSQTPLFEFRD